jgi:hypothetical protein
MRATLVTPRGTKVKTQTQRRYVVVAEQITDGLPTGASIEKRSDALSTLETHVRRRGAHSGSLGYGTRRFIFDTRTGEQV